MLYLIANNINVEWKVLNLHLQWANTMFDMRQKYNTFAADNLYWPDFIGFTYNPHLMFLWGAMDRKTTLWKILYRQNASLR